MSEENRGFFRGNWDETKRTGKSILDWIKNKIFNITLCFILVIVALFILSIIPCSFLMFIGIDTREKFTINEVLTLVTVIIGLVLIYKTLIATEKQLRSTEKKVDTALIQVAKDRFERICEKVNNHDTNNRLRGLSRLQSFSQESQESYDLVWQFLCDFLRKPPDLNGYPPLQDQQNMEQELKKIENKEKRKEKEKEYYEKTGFVLRGQRSDIQKIMKMLFEMKNTARYNPHIIDLSGAVLQGFSSHDVVDLISANLSGADLTSTALTNLKASEVKLPRACLFDAFLGRSDLSDADVTDADLTYANLMFADLDKVDLLKAKSLLGTNIYEAENLSDEDRKAALEEGAVEIGGSFGDYVDLETYKKIFEAGKHPIFLQKLQEEIDKAKTTGDVPAFVDRFMEQHNIK